MSNDMNNYIKQVWYELRHQPMVTTTSILGTAFSIFMVMAVFITSSIDTVEVSPESNRSRMLYGKYIHVKHANGESSGSLAYNTALKLYDNLDGVEKISFSGGWQESQDVAVGNSDVVSLPVKMVDDVFWELFDFDFVSGKPFDKATVESGLKRVIITRSVAIKFFGREDVAGQEIKISHVPYVIQGVVKDTSPLLKESFAKVFIPFQKEKEEDLWAEGLAGNSQVYLLMAENGDENKIRQQVKNRYATMNSQLKKQGVEIIYHEAPFNASVINQFFGSNNTPDFDGPQRMRYLVYTILLILPAINLSSMTRSRLRRRVAEIGVRRAYGATKAGIISRLLGENMILTLAGGLIGLILCIIFVALFSNFFISYGGTFASGEIVEASPTFNMTLNLKTFGIALLFCLILNLLSTGMPAWRASRVNPAEAISGKND